MRSSGVSYLIVFLIVWHLGTDPHEVRAQAWTPLPKVTSANLFRMCFLDSLRGWVVGDSGTILKTTDGGAHWTFQNSGITRNIVEVFFVDTLNGWALASVFPDTSSFEYGTLVLKTTDGGGTWTSVWHPDNIYLTVFFFNAQRGWMGGEFGRIVGTTNGGLTWFPATIDSSDVGSLAVRRIRFFSDSVGYGVGGRVELIGVVWKTTNGGSRWTPRAEGADPILDVHFFDSVNALGISGGFDDGTSMIRTSNAGQQWEYEYIGIWGEPRALAFRTRTEGWSPLGFAGTMMKTTDSGQTWLESYAPDSTAMYDVVFTDSLTGYMVGENGTILKQSRRTVDVSHISTTAMPVTPFLSQNFPNPFNPSTTIRYTVGQTSTVTVKIFNIMGQEVTTLVNERNQQGTFHVTWDGKSAHGARAAAGVYIVTLEVRSGHGSTAIARSRKMVLLN